MTLPEEKNMPGDCGTLLCLTRKFAVTSADVWDDEWVSDTALQTPSLIHSSSQMVRTGTSKVHSGIFSIAVVIGKGGIRSHQIGRVECTGK